MVKYILGSMIYVPQNLSRVKEWFERKNEYITPLNIAIPDNLCVGKYSIILDENTVVRNMHATQFPFNMKANWLSPLLCFRSDIAVSLTVEPLDKESILKYLKMQIVRERESILYKEGKGKIIDSSEILNIQQLEDLKVHLEKGVENLFDVSLNAFIKSNIKEDHLSMQRKFQSLASADSLQLRNSSFRQLSSFLQTLPLLSLKERDKFIFDTTSLALSNIFSSSNLIEKDGIFYGRNKNTNGIVIIDRFKRENFNSVTLAKSGSGKSFSAKLEIIRMFLKGVKIIVIDQEGEYVNLCKNLKGEVIKLGIRNKGIDPFFISSKVIEEKGYEDKIQFLKFFFKRICSFYDENLLDRALVKIYQNKKATPSMYALYNSLRKMGSKGILMSDQIYSFAKGSVGKLYSPSYINLENQLIVFDVSSLDDENKKRMMMVIGEYVWSSITETERKARMLVIDEAHKILDNDELSSYFKSITKRARKYSLGIHFITQDIGDFLKSEDGKSIIANCATKYLLGQEKLNVKYLKDNISISEAEEEMLLSLDRGECLVISGRNHIHTLIDYLPFEKDLIEG